ncbi:thiamine-monophosphate kinase [bacterium]|nr:thiamine-monophosphate kinase [bacterium]
MHDGRAAACDGKDGVPDMSGMDGIRENAIINAWAGRFRRSPDQHNEPHETDAELVEMPGEPERFLAITIDTVSEEILEGIYRDPHTMGWVTAVASLSDLAAVGADPIGIVVSVSTTPDADEEFTRGVAEGLEYACRAHGVFILGGDTNAAPTTSLTACAVGLVPRERVLTRKGAAPGDAVFLSGHAGIGNALGLARLGGLPDDAFLESGYRPTAELAMGRLLRGFASSCMDTSDGVFATLDQMMRINGTGFVIDCNCSRMLDPNVLDFCKRTDTPQWLMAAGPHGEFKLLFTVSPEKVAGFMGAVTREGLAPVSLGTVQERRAVSVMTDAGTTVDVDVARLRNLLYDVEGDMERFVREFVKAVEEWGLK